VLIELNLDEVALLQGKTVGTPEISD